MAPYEKPAGRCAEGGVAGIPNISSSAGRSAIVKRPLVALAAAVMVIGIIAVPTPALARDFAYPNDKQLGELRALLGTAHSGSEDGPTLPSSRSQRDSAARA